MITKERLEELIEQEATIWAVYDEDRIEQIKLVVRMFGVSVDEYNKLHDCEPTLFSKFCGIYRDICPISWLFETLEETEWHREFGCIERTERLELPTWEEVQKCSLYTLYFNNQELYLYRVYFNRDAKTITIEEQNEEYLECFTEIEELDLTRENYTLACRKCKELFLGKDS